MSSAANATGSTPMSSSSSSSSSRRRVINSVAILDRHPSLVLKADYQPLQMLPLTIWSWQDAVKVVLSGKAIIVDIYPNVYVRAINLDVPVTSVIALREYAPMGKARPAFTRCNVFLCNGYRCQYCIGLFCTWDLLLDHVKPHCLGGRLTVVDMSRDEDGDSIEDDLSLESRESQPAKASSNTADDESDCARVPGVICIDDHLVEGDVISPRATSARSAHPDNDVVSRTAVGGHRALCEESASRGGSGGEREAVPMGGTVDGVGRVN
ncbi:hypothetical protein ACHAXA_006852 [Cyclostephanos tholiformis]|uniref:C2H2-type domain-containing protein n=1 Tax=Cyclostephanos tholiformis TaxID=382380 RepID=A0ABD3R522_9STRA